MEYTGGIERAAGVKKSQTFNRILNRLQLRDKKVLDLGCGFGEYLLLFGKNSIGITTRSMEVEYGERHGIPIRHGNVEELDKIKEMQSESFEAIWCNNLFEHLLAPHRFLNSLKRYADGETKLILGVPVVPGISSLMRITRFRGALSVAHINFFTRKTLQLSVERAGWKVLEARPFLFSNRLLDNLFGFIAPHIYIVAQNDASFAYHEKKLFEWEGESYYDYVLETTKQK